MISYDSHEVLLCLSGLQPNCLSALQPDCAGDIRHITQCYAAWWQQKGKVCYLWADVMPAWMGGSGLDAEHACNTCKGAKGST